MQFFGFCSWPKKGGWRLTPAKPTKPVVSVWEKVSGVSVRKADGFIRRSKQKAMRRMASQAVAGVQLFSAARDIPRPSLLEASFISFEATVMRLVRGT